MKPTRLWTVQQRNAPYLFVLPFVLLFLTFLLYPLCRSVVLSFYKTSGAGGRMKFVGAGNYLFLVRDPYFWIALANTAGYVAAFLLIQVPASLGLALLLNSPRVRARAFFRFAFFYTHLIGQVFVAVLFSQLLTPRHGPINKLIELAAQKPIELNWLSDPLLARFAVVLTWLWLSIGFGMIYFLAALQAVERDLYEAAEVDGAGRWSRFIHITLPGIRPVALFLILVGTIAGFQLFEIPFVLFRSSNGPAQAGLTVVGYLFTTGFLIGDLGYASAIGWMLVLIILAVSIAQLRITGLFKAVS